MTSLTARAAAASLLLLGGCANILDIHAPKTIVAGAGGGSLEVKHGQRLRIPLAADPALTTHRAYGVPGIPFTPELARQLDGIALTFAREQGIAAEPGTAHAAINAIDGYRPTPEDQADFDRHQAQLIGQFLIDRDGVVRWVNIERVPAEFPAEGELLAAARSAAA